MNLAMVKLSNREKECLQYIRQGRTAKETANFLNISRRTVETHIVHIKDKFNCHTKSQLLNKLMDYEGVVAFH